MKMKWKIGSVEIENPFILAPMAGVTDLPFRILCKEQGAGLLCTEMVSAKAISFHNKNTISLMQIDPVEHPVSMQIFGSEPDLMAEVAKSIEEQPFDILDINMGCPVPKGVKIRSFIHGGAQERKRRACTENVPGIVGYGVAAERAANTMEERTAKERKIRDHLIDRVLAEVPYTRLNGHRTDRLPNNANFSFQFVEGESLLIMLDMDGICGSSGSACTSGSLDPSHVLLAIGLPHEIAHGSLRLTLSEETTMEDVDYVVDCIKKIVERLRSMSPLYEDFIRNH